MLSSYQDIVHTSHNDQLGYNRSMPKNTAVDVNTLPPQSIETEKSLLGSVLLDKEAIAKVADFLDEHSFYSRSHQIIFDHILRLYERREPIDVLTVSNILEESGELQNVGGASYLSSLVNSTPTSAHITHYGRIVERKKILRDLIDAAHTIMGLGHQEDNDIENILDQAEQKLFSVSQKSIQQNFTSIGKTLQDAFDRIDKLHKGDGSLRGQTTGFVDIDTMTAGLQRSNLIILAARPSFGKTSLALDIARNAGREVPVGVFSLEMSKDEIVDRLISAEANVNLWKMRTGRLSSEGDNNDFEKIAAALDSLAQSKLFIEDTSGLTVLQMRAMARRLQAEHGLGLLIIDYLQLMNSKRDYDSPVQQITEISRGLKGLARELNIPVLALSQLSRAVENRPDQRPRLSDLRDSGSIEQDADLVMFIHREDKVKKDSEKKNIAEILIAKHRNGPTGQVELYFDEDYASFKNLAKHF